MKQRVTSRSAGLDALRLLATVLVTVQHILSLSQRDQLTTAYGLNIGQVGVAIFLGASAYLSVTSATLPSVWLGRRLIRVFPAYWLATAAGFVLTGAFHYKNFTVAQVASQMAGLGLFTHPSSLVNVPTW